MKRQTNRTEKDSTMELRTVDPRILIDNPDNPRRKAPPDQADLQMAAGIRAVGVLQPPVVREAANKLMTIYGHRRVRGSIAAERSELAVLVLGETEHVDDDQLRAMVENIVRKAMSPVEQWRAIETLVSERWTEEAISTALVLPVRTLKKLRLLARIYTPMLDRMHAGDMPAERELCTIASASLEEQAAAWKKNRPKKGEEVGWWQLAQALTRRRMRAAAARFDAEFAAAYGVEYVEDLFAPADQDSRATTNVDGFLAAQHAWVEANLPANGVVLQTEEYGGAKLPPRAQRYYGKPGQGGETVGFYVNANTGAVETVLFTVPVPTPTKTGSGQTAGGTPNAPAKVRADVTQKGEAMIGNMRTDALHTALRDEPIDSAKLIALLVLALAGKNVEVKTGRSHIQRDNRREIADMLTEGGALTSDPGVLQSAACEMLTYTLSCRDNWSNSGAVARIAGDAIGADAHLPNMATADFLACLSKAATERAATDLTVHVESTGKATRAAIVARIGQGRWIYPAALFSAPTEAFGADTGRKHRDAEWVPAATGQTGAGDDEDAPPDGGTDSIEPSTADGTLATEAAANTTARPDDDPLVADDRSPDDAPEPGTDAEPAAPAPRRRTRKDSGETHAAA